MSASWPRCRRCHTPTGTGRASADDCFECAEWPESITAARFAFVLETPATEMTHALKYEGWSRAAVEMGRATAEAARALLEDDPASIVVPVPTTVARIRERGYNQAALIARSAGRALGLEVLEALERPDSARSQTSLDPGQRRDNVRGAFRSTARGRTLRGATVLLIDDVLTTGATVGAAATVLKEGGADRVFVATFARALPRRSGVRKRVA